MLWPAVLSSVAALGALMSAVMAIRRRFTIVTVSGRSMEPTLTAGDRVLIRRARLRYMRTGQIVVIESAVPCAALTGEPASRARTLMIKRVAAVPGEPLPAGMPAAIADAAYVPDGNFVVLGDNPSMSADSRVFGYVPAARTHGIVIRSLPRRPGKPEPT